VPESRTRFIRPEIETLTLADGATLTVRKRLTAGEQRAHYSRIYIAGVDGRLHTNPLAVGRSLIVAYLLDWSFVDHEGARVKIEDLSPDQLAQVLDSLSIDAFAEVRRAVEAHDDKMIAEREEQKKTTAGATASSSISPSPVAAGGVTNGSGTSTPTSTISSLTS
jgi:hypothetical protein